MKLIACPDCGREVSARATSCPGCGLAEPGAVLSAEVADRQSLADARVTRRANIEILLLTVPSFAGVLWLIPKLPEDRQLQVLLVYVPLVPIAYVWRRYKARKREEASEQR